MHHKMRRAVSGDGGGGGYSAKSLVMDCADTYPPGYPIMSFRLMEFLNPTVLGIVSADYTAYQTTTQAGFTAQSCFDYTASKIGANATNNSWFSATDENTNQRLIAVFNTPISFSGIQVNNFHDAGSNTYRGIENVKLYTSSDAITSTVYNEAIPNSVLIYDGVFKEHVALDQADDEVLTLI